MASLAYIFAAATPVPEDGDRYWGSRYSAWRGAILRKYVEGRTGEEMALDSEAFRSVDITSGGSGRRTLEAGIGRLAVIWLEKVLGPWVAAGRPFPVPTMDLVDYERISGEEIRLGWGPLIRYRAGVRKVARSKLPPGATHAFLSNVGDPFEFAELLEQRRTELKILWEICRIYGGHYLAIWTFGHSIHVWHAASPEPGDAPRITVADFRLFAPCGRSGRGLESLRQALAGAPLTPDFDALRAELDADAISVESWFSAFGVDGAREIQAANREEVWALFEHVARTLLSGETADMKDIRELNELIAPLNERAKLKSKPPKRAGRTAADVAWAASTLVESVGLPEDDAWQERFRAARTFWDIGEGPAGDRLVTMNTPIGRAAGLARLLGHYPRELARDPLFHPLAATEAESANGHAFVEPLYILAETVETAGFTLAIHPGEADVSFKRGMKVAGGPEEPGEWAAQAFIDLPKAEPDTVLAALEEWYAKEGADGLVLRAEADGSFRLLRFEAGEAREEAPADADAVADAGRRLVPGDAFRGLGHADLLAPGEWTEGAYEGGSSTSDADRAKALEALAGKPSIIEISAPRELVDHVGSMIRGVTETVRNDRGQEFETYFRALRLCPACDDPDELLRLRADFGPPDPGYHASAWVEGDCVNVYSNNSYYVWDTQALAGMIADLPAGTVVRIAGDGGPIEARLTTNGSGAA